MRTHEDARGRTRTQPCDAGGWSRAAPAAQPKLLGGGRALWLRLLRVDLEDGRSPEVQLAAERGAEASLACRLQEDHHLVLGLPRVLDQDGGHDRVEIVDGADRHALLHLLVRLRARPDAVDQLVRRAQCALCELLQLAGEASR